jgi:hypothetical protein
VEEYITEIFELVDTDIDRPALFGDYGHFMIIHAGSDWQHDVFGDSPNDLPSMFIELGDNSPILVDNNTFEIRRIANVPEYITQDIRERTYSDGTKTTFHDILTLTVAGVYFYHDSSFVKEARQKQKEKNRFNFEYFQIGYDMAVALAALIISVAAIIISLMQK